MKIKFLIATIAVFGFVFFLGYKALAVCVSCSSDAECSGSQICYDYEPCHPGKSCHPLACSDTSPCPDGRKCTGGSCERTTPGGPPTPAGSVPKDGRCTTAVDCEGAWGCRAGVCQECVEMADCYKKGTCFLGRCTGAPPAGEHACSIDSDCAGFPDKPKCDPIQHICFGGAAPEEEKYKYEPVYPKLQIPIPGIPSLTEFAKVEIKTEGLEEKRYVYIPWISQYIAAVYGWAMGIVGILATVMIVWGGVIYLTAGGTPERISTAKDYITSALAGLLLAFGSYLLLYTINPDLVKFGAMKIEVIERKEFEEGKDFASIEYDEEQGESASASTTIPSSSEDCKKVGELIGKGEIGAAKPYDSAALIAGGIGEKRNQCKWCYGSNPSTDACGGGQFSINPKVCKLILELYNAKKEGKITLTKNFIRCIICPIHSRCAKTEGTTACETCKKTGKGESKHWTGRGIDLPPDSDLQKYIVNNLMGLGISQVIGPEGWDHKSIQCGKPRTGSATSQYLCNGGKCGVSYGATTLCGHIDHIHVGF